jgi:uncharacterized delta-60 repeat protein
MAHPTQDQLEANAFGFSVCATESTDLAIDSEIHGQPECACEHDCRAMWYWWGVDLLSRTPTDDCDCDDKCVDPNLACEAIGLLAPGCVTCGCGSPDDVPQSCDIVQDRTVYQALDADQQTVVPNVAGRTTLVISNLTNVTNDWSANLGNIGTDDGAGTFSWYVPPTSTIVLSSANSTYYVTYPGGAGPLYPPIDGTQNFTTLVLISRFPAITLMYGRTVVVEISEDGVTWTPIYSGPETPLAYGVTLTLVDGYLPVQSRTTYYYGEEDECSYQYALGTIPPFVPPPCGVLVYTITPNSICGTETWNVSINFTQIDGWGIGTVTPVINGTPGTAQSIILGTRTFGPFIMGDLVTFDFTSNLDTDCDFSTQTYFDPRVVEQDYNVLRAVDANEYAALNGDGNDYYIVSNVNGVTNPWSPYNGGAIWVGATSSLIPVFSLQVVYATDPGGALGFWQRPIGAPAAMFFPQPTFTYNTVTLIAAVTLPPVAPFTQAWATLFIQALWTPPAGSPVTVFNGTPDAFVPDGFSIPNTTTWSAVTGRAIYSDGCAVPVPAITDTFTPTGPDPNFSEIGVNAGVNSSGAGPNGSFYIGGFFMAYDEPGANIPANSFTRLNSDGTLDTAFNSVVTDTSFMRVVGAGTAGSIGKYLQGPNVNAKPSYTFTNAGVNYSISWSGTQWQIRNVTTAALLYHSVNDTPFPSSATTWLADTGTAPVPTVTTGGFNLDLRDMAVDAFGRIVCAGSFTTFNDVSRPHIARINPDGTLDTTFVVGTGFNSTVTGVSIDSSNRVICTGGFTQYNGVFVGYCVRLNVDGSIDTTFNYNNGLIPPAPYAGFNGNTYRNIIDADSTIIVNSGQGSYDAYTDQTGTTIAIPSWTLYKKALVRLNVNGSLASLTTQGLAMNGSVAPIQNSFAIQPNGDIICVGAFTTYGTDTVNRIVRMDSVGNIDTAFLANTDPGFDSVNAQTAGIAVLPNGQILVGCAAGDTYQGGFTGGLIRLKADGTLDGTFNIGTGFTGGSAIVIDILVTTLGDIIVSGVFTALDGVPRFYVAKF